MAAKERSTFTQADGHQLFADMLRDVHQHWGAREDGVPEEQIGDLWRNDDGAIVRRYLHTVSTASSDALAQGFFAALTEYIGSCEDGGPVAPEFFELDKWAGHRQ